MPIEDLLDSAAADIVAHGGREATYTNALGVSADLRVFFAQEVEMQPDGQVGPAWAQLETVQGLLADFGQEPDEGDTIEIDGTTYNVTRVLDNDGRWVKVAVKEA